MNRRRRRSEYADEWTRVQESGDESRLCAHCLHPILRHYSSAAGITRLCGCGCTIWSKPA